MEFGEVVRSRRSVRDYDSSREVSDEQLEELFELVKLSPSSYNLQPWEFIVVRDSGNKKQLQLCANNQKHVGDASAVVIILGNKNPLARAERVFSDREKKGHWDEARMIAATAKLAELGKDDVRSRIWTVKSTSLAAMTLMLAAKDMGLDTCPIESMDANRIRKEFSIPDNYEVILLITLGYKLKEPMPALMRYGYEEIVHFEKFGKKE